MTLTDIQAVLLAAGLTLIGLGPMLAIRAMLAADTDTQPEPQRQHRERSDRQDADPADLINWDFTQQGAELRTARLWATPLDELREQARLQEIRGWATMTQPELIEALGGDPVPDPLSDEALDGKLVIVDGGDGPPVTVHPGHRPWTNQPPARQWAPPPPRADRPLLRRPEGDHTQEFRAITGHDGGLGPDEGVTPVRGGARYIQPAVGWVTR